MRCLRRLRKRHEAAAKILEQRAHGYLQEAEACSLILKDLERISAKLQRRIDKEAAARQADFEAAMQYHSEAEIQDAYGWEFITEAQYHAYLDLFRRGREAIENHPPTISEMALAIMRKVIRDLESDKREYEFSALTPEQQVVELQRAEQARKEWKAHIAQLRGETGPCTQIRGFGGFTALAFLRQPNALPNRQRHHYKGSTNRTAMVCRSLSL